MLNFQKDNGVCPGPIGCLGDRKGGHFQLKEQGILDCGILFTNIFDWLRCVQKEEEKCLKFICVQSNIEGYTRYQSK